MTCGAIVGYSNGTRRAQRHLMAAGMSVGVVVLLCLFMRLATLVS